MRDDPLRAARVLALAGPLALLAGAYLSQYGFGLFPCEMCWWQRYAHFAALAFAVLAWMRPPGRAALAAGALAIAVAGAIGGFHAGVEYGWWKGFTACTSALDTSIDPLEAIMNAPIVRCDVAPWSWLGVSLAGWNFLLSTALAIVLAVLLARSRSGGR